MKIVMLFLLMGLLHSFLFAQMSQSHHAYKDLDCSGCHSCEEPTYEDPCLKICPDLKRDADSHQELLKRAPEILILDKVVKNYAPSLFPHKLHAEMIELSQGCASCHHYNVAEKILSCSDCHVPDKIRDDLTKPALVGAYHQQCMDCHLGKNKQTDCGLCHNLKDTTATHDQIISNSSFSGKSHFSLQEPEKIVKKTEFEDAPVVTFFHMAHVKQYDIYCMKCHNNERCSDCHESVRPFVKTEHEAHAKCMSCHEESINDNCYKCHDTKEKSPFDHAQVGWPLKSYHAGLNCKKCHTGETGFSKLDKSCSACHKNWEVGSFDHSVTGVALDEMHAEVECETCHLDRNFATTPDCNVCHEEIRYPDQVPGRKLSKK